MEKSNTVSSYADVKEDRLKQSVISEKIDELQRQNCNLDSFWKDVAELSSRLRTIGNKLNSVEHPDNNQAVDIEKGQLIGKSPELKRTPDGLVGDLNNVIGVRESLLNSWRNDLYPNLLRQINYIELHV